MSKTQISLHFTREEFACKCGCGQDTIDAQLITLCEHMRSLNNAPITPTSGNRCAEYNKKIGGSKNSQHILGRAADLPVNDPARVYKRLRAIYEGQYGFGLYDTFIHVDSRKDMAWWDNRTNK